MTISSLRSLPKFLLALAMLAALTAPAAAIDTTAKQAILVDFNTGGVLYEKNADEPAPPSSMSKMMTVYLLFERLKSGAVKLDDTFPVSRKAWKMGGSKMFVRVDTRVAVDDLLHGIITQSGNDACIVVAEALGGTEEGFAELMNKKGKELGLEHSKFANATGWPDPNDMMSVRDLAKLAAATIRNFPDFYKRYYGLPEFTFNNIRQHNRNPVIGKIAGGDGLKTGHTDAGGYGVAASAERDGRRLILVLNGLGSWDSRVEETGAMLEWGFREFRNYALFKAGDTAAEADVWLGTEPTVPLVTAAPVTVTLPIKSRDAMKVKVVYDGVAAPVKKGDKLGDLVVSAPDTKDIVVPLYAGADVEKKGMFGRIGAALNRFVSGG
ncbi:MAG TPA: D-alanyl-D-alanine carboxypeptidase family protein [Alphaproteobacteria bacterium]|jgi:D-alanyl-D-alanine carboxypeptidase (penicillin-binding protein 5/6)|nr:D-alanyl-D-alanine carboxypeptidase family protein [Alphaproteobacteria bacterium]